MKNKTISIDRAFRKKADFRTDPCAIEKNRNPPISWQIHPIWFGNVQIGNRFRLPLSQYRILDSAISKNGERLCIHRGFRRPHTKRFMTEAVLKISNSPFNLSNFIFSGG